jgi:2-oxoglutarate dehydrogenase E2 component (dihydrolipoamide succinyltransferase)
MAFQVKIPQVGESITEVTISNWLKKDGDFVNRDEILVEVETDKATQEFPAETSGILKITVQQGETVPVGAIIATIEEAKGANPAPKADSVPAATPVAADRPAKATGVVKDQIVPQVGESITEVTLSNWLKADGELVNLDDAIAELESDKATFEYPAEAKGILRHVAKAGDTVKIGGVIAKIEVMEGGATATKTVVSAAASAPNPMPVSGGNSYAAGHPSPVAAKILSEKGIDASTVSGTGIGGRITKEDAEKAQNAPKQSPMKEEAAIAPVFGGSRNQRREKMSSMRKTISKRLVAVTQETAMLTTFNEVDMKPIMDLRNKYKDKFKEKNEVGLGFMSFFIKAAALALKEWPAVNAFIDDTELVYNDYADIAIAVSTPKGLVVPVIRNAEMLSFSGVEKEVVRLAKRGRDGKLSIPEMQGGTFTITNGGIFGSMLSTPIINAPQSAILGMHNIVERPVAINGQVEIRPIMYLALSYDHRVIDGRESVSFLYRMKELLEDPSRLLLEI